MTKRLILTFLPMLCALAACSSPPPAQPASDLVSILKARPSLKQFANALENSGVAGSLAADGAYTIFAPMDKAVNAALDEATIRHHILPTRVTFSDMAGENTSYETLNNDEIEVDVTERIVIGSALMVESDIEASNGIIHVIDRVQRPGPGPARLLEQPLSAPTALTPDGGAVIPSSPAAATN
jgi:uncharacterized surface protein with fasciclin (FAS1) repeats